MNEITTLPDKNTILSKLDIPAMCLELIPSLKPSGNGHKNFIGLCPFHDDHKPSLSVSHEGLYKCFACPEKGNFIGLYMKVKGQEYKEAIKELAARAGYSQEKKQAVKQVMTSRFDYHNPDGALLYWKERMEPGKNGREKEFFFYHGNGESGRKSDPVLYNLPSVLQAASIIITEGELKANIVNAWEIESHAGTTMDTGAQSKLNELMIDQLASKRIVILPDNDEPGIMYALNICKVLNSKCPSIKVVQLPGLPAKGDIVDWVKDTANTKEKLQELISATPDWMLETPVAQDYPAPYLVDNAGYLCRRKETRDGSIPVRLANFTASITEEIVEDNGLEIQHHYLISGRTLKRTLSSIEISATQFANMNWLHKWGTEAIIEPGQSSRDYVRHAIQMGSAEKALKKKVYTHTGWRESNGKWVYLSNAGGVGGENIAVRLSPELSRYSLPLQPVNETEAIRASISFLELGKREITLPLLLMTYLAPLTTILNPMPNFSGYLYGMTGTFKTTLSILQLAHFGHFTGIEGLSNFDDSANSVEKRAFTLKDTLLILDDYHPSHRRQDAQTKESLAQRLIRAYSNRTARGRLNSDTTDKGRYTPRGFMQITGEELVVLQSTLARVLVVEVAPGGIDKTKLTELQNKAEQLPHAMTSFILWVKENMADIKESFPAKFRELRDKASNDGSHKKLPEQTAYLAFVAELMADWFVSKSIMSETEAIRFVSDTWNTLKTIAEKQVHRLDDEDPVKRFAEILNALLQREAKLEHAKVCGGAHIGTGDTIGYYDEQFLYLLPTPLWHMLGKYSLSEGGHFPFGKTTMYNILKSKNLLISNANGKSTTSFRRDNNVHSVLKISIGVWLKMGLQGLQITGMQDCIEESCIPESITEDHRRITQPENVSLM
ncbi:MAG: CHC2 zinc finger domain-containing protein [Deltaproteobacteria bacterium]